MSVNTYDPSKIALYIGGYRITGINSVDIRWTTPAFRMIRGIRGVNTRVGSMDTSAEMTLTILQASISNDILSQIVRLDRSLQTGRLTLSLKDLGGQTLVESDDAFVENLPDVSFSKQLQGRSWKITLLSTRNPFLGSNVKYGEKDVF